MSYSFHPAAEEEFLEAIDYYERCREGLGVQFAHEVHAAIDRILAHPGAWPVLNGEVRRCQAASFPYGIVYAETEAGICILAVMHLHRQPDYWRGRE